MPADDPLEEAEVLDELPHPDRHGERVRGKRGACLLIFIFTLITTLLRGHQGS